MHLQQTTFENLLAKGEIGEKCFSLYLLWRFFRFLSLCFQSRLLQICCMWERVKCHFFHQICSFLSWALERYIIYYLLICLHPSLYTIYSLIQRARTCKITITKPNLHGYATFTRRKWLNMSR